MAFIELSDDIVNAINVVQIFHRIDKSFLVAHIEGQGNYVGDVYAISSLVEQEAGVPLSFGERMEVERQLLAKPLAV